MARLARFVLPDHPQHIILKGINKMTLFKEDADFEHYLGLLKEGCAKHQCALHAYCLLPSEIHLLLTPSTEQGVSKLMQMMGRYYVQHFNKKYDRSGTLWEGRYRGTLVDPENYLLKVYRFIELLPVSNDLVDKPTDYVWSSYAENSSALSVEGLLAAHKEYLQLAPDPAQRGQIYALLHQAGLSEEESKAIHNSSLKGWVIGTPEYQAQVEALTHRQVAPKPKGGDRRSEKYRETERLKQLGLSDAEIEARLSELDGEKEAEKKANKQAEAKKAIEEKATDQIDKAEAEAVVADECIEIDQAAAESLASQFLGGEEMVNENVSSSLSALETVAEVEVLAEAAPAEPEPEPEPVGEKEPKKTKAQQRKEELEEVQGSLF